MMLKVLQRNSQDIIKMPASGTIYATTGRLSNSTKDFLYHTVFLINRGDVFQPVDSYRVLKNEELTIYNPNAVPITIRLAHSIFIDVSFQIMDYDYTMTKVGSLWNILGKQFAVIYFEDKTPYSNLYQANIHRIILQESEQDNTYCKQTYVSGQLIKHCYNLPPNNELLLYKQYDNYSGEPKRYRIKYTKIPEISENFGYGGHQNIGNETKTYLLYVPADYDKLIVQLTGQYQSSPTSGCSIAVYNGSSSYSANKIYEESGLKDSTNVFQSSSILINPSSCEHFYTVAITNADSALLNAYFKFKSIKK